MYYLSIMSLWILASSTGKVSNGWIRDLGFNYPTYTKNWFVSWSDDIELSLGAEVIGWSSLSKKKKSVMSLVNGIPLANLLMDCLKKKFNTILLLEI